MISAETLWLVGGGLAIAGFIMLRIEVMQTRVSESVARCHTRIDDLHATCVTREELEQRLSRIETSLNRIADKIERMQPCTQSH